MTFFINTSFYCVFTIHKIDYATNLYEVNASPLRYFRLIQRVASFVNS